MSSHDNTFDHSAARVPFDSDAKFLRAPHQELAERQVFGDVYVLVRKLGQGGMGQCWQADEYADEKRQGRCRSVVIKIVPPDVQNAEDEMERVEDVFYATEKLNHPHICPVYALKRDKNFGHYLVMRYIDGKPLNKHRRELRQKGGITLDDALTVFKPLAEALDYAHRQKVIHRDIKPSNVMLENGVPYLIDFGLAAQIRTSVTKVSKAITSKSGTLIYMSPEQWEGEPQKEQTDQYALGVMLYEFLGGEPPFLSDNTEIMYRLVTQKKMPPLEGFSESVNSALAKALAKERKERWGSCTEFIKAFYQSPFKDIFAAAEKGTVQDIAYFIDNGADIHAKACLGWTPLHRASRNNSNVAILQFLLDHGADVHAKDNYGRSPLYRATQENRAIIRKAKVRIEANKKAAADAKAKVQVAAYKPQPRLAVDRAVSESPIGIGASVEGAHQSSDQNFQDDVLSLSQSKEKT